MATTQQAIDTKYDYYLALRDEKLKELFSPVILVWARQNGLNTFEDMINYAGVLSLNNANLKTLHGVDLLKALTGINFSYNQLTDVGDLSGLSELTSLYIIGNPLTNVGNLSLLTKLTTIVFSSNQLTDIGSLSKLISLTYVELAYNQLTDIGDLSGLVALTYLGVSNNNLTTAKVDKVLTDMHTAYDATGNIATISLNGANMGIPTDGASNADYVYLTNAGVSVTIQTA